MVFASCLALVVGCGVLILALEYRPAWYAPFALTEAQLQQGRMDAMRVVDLVGDRLVDRRPFEIALSDEQWNTWLSGIAQIWPDAAKEIPREVIEPFVAFEAGRIRTAARLESKGWRAVFGSDYGLELSSDKKQLIVRLHSAQCGAVTLPRFIVGSLARPYLRGQAAHGHTIDELYDGVPLENHFVWPNGRRPFRFKEITIEPGKIRLLIEPL